MKRIIFTLYNHDKSHFSANDFISKWRGCVKGMENVSDEELDRIKYEYLKQKYFTSLIQMQI